MGTYKDSGIEWIGEIPEEWEVSKVKYKYEFTTGFTPDTSNSEFYDDENGAIWVTIADIDENKYIFDSKSKLSSIYIETYTPKPVKKGSLLYSFKLSVGKTAFAGTDLYTNEAIGAFINHENVNLNYLNYASFLMEFNANRNIYNAKLLNSTLIKNSITVVPPLQEQAAIADFLDKKNAEIDAITAKITQQIQTLKDYRYSLITQTVTKGLDKTVAYKDSGIEWIGEIPEGWGITRMQDVASYKKGPFGSSLTLDMFVEKGESTYKVYEQKNAIQGDSHLGEYYIDEKTYNQLRGFSVQSNDIIVSCAGTIGKCTILPENCEPGIINQALMRVRINKNINIFYYLYLFNIELDYADRKFSNGSAIKNIPPFNVLKKLKLPLPPLQEQSAIADFLDDKTSKIDCIIAKKEQQLELIKEHRKSLIYEYVTGKKRVKEYQQDGN